MLSRVWLSAGVLTVLLGTCVQTAFQGTFAQTVQAATAESPVGKKAAEFRLADPSGKEYRLGDLKDARLVVVMFLGTECPLARLYAPR